MQTQKYSEASRLKILEAAKSDFANAVGAKKTLSAKLNAIDSTFLAVYEILSKLEFRDNPELVEIAESWRAYVKAEAVEKSLPVRLRRDFERFKSFMTIRRIMAIYILWMFVNLMFLVLSPHPFGEGSRYRSYGAFYPMRALEGFDYRGNIVYGKMFDRTEYDITEFSFYVLLPSVLVIVIKLFKNPS